eukprot:Hpha_TRINITY_DN15643_c1_g17::TRINITY_DN15643_c1_g17_i1::g.101311::m.101311
MGNQGSSGPPPPPPKTWEKGAWYGLLMDPYVEGMQVPCTMYGSGAQLASMLWKLSREPALLPGWDPGVLRSLRPLSKKLKRMGELARKTAQVEKPEQLSDVTGDWLEDIQGVNSGGFCFLPGGWKQPQNAQDNHVVQVLLRPDPDPQGVFNVVVCNGGNEGIEYHPTSLECPEKLRYKTSFSLADVPRGKVANPAFLSVLLSHRVPQASHCKEAYYDALLGWLADERGETMATLIPNVENDPCASWRTPARARTSGWKSLWEAVRYVLRKRFRASEAQLKELSFALRRMSLADAQRDLLKLDDPQAALRPQRIRQALCGLSLLPPRSARPEPARGLIEGKNVALFFGGAWCRATRDYVDKLATMRSAVVAAGKPFDVIYVSADRGEDEFRDFTRDMPWPCIEYGDPDCDELQEMFDVNQFPTVVMIDQEMNLLNRDAAQAIAQDPSGAGFPYRDGGRDEAGKRALEILKTTPLQRRGEEAAVVPDRVKDKHIALYFAAEESQSSKSFQPRLQQVYERLQSRGEFEVVYVSMDEEQEQYDRAVRSSHWLSLPFQSTEKDEVVRAFGVEALPRIVMLDPEGAVTSSAACDAIARDPGGESFPWPSSGDEQPEGLSPDDRTRLRIGCRQIARCALKEFEADRLQLPRLREIEAEIQTTSDLSDRLLERWETTAGRPPALPSECKVSKDVVAQDHAGYNLLLETDEDQYRGGAAVIHEPPLADLLSVPPRDQIQTPAQAFDALERCDAVVGDLLARSAAEADAAFSSSRVAVQQQGISLIQNTFIEGIPLPLPIGATEGCMWDQGMSVQDQTRGMKAIYALLFRLATLWQDVERSSRQADSERALAAACAFAIFDRSARSIAHGGPSLTSRLLSDPQQGYQLHTGVDERGKARFEEISKYLELDTPEMCRSRASATAYFRSMQKTGLQPLFRVGVASVGNVSNRHEDFALRALTFDMHDPTMQFVNNLVIQSGLRPQPPEAREMCQFPVEFMAGYLTANAGERSPFAKLAQKQPQWPFIRDTCILFKFLYSLLPRVDEAMMFRQRMLRNVQHLPLTHNPPQTGHRGRQRLDEIQWEKHRTHGAQKEKVDLMARSFDNRVIVWGQGPVIFSPSNPKWLLRNDSQIPKSWYVTEDDVLHADARSLEAVRYQQTLSVEEAHRMLTYLVAPYMRMPLVAHFFADLQRDPSAGGELRAGNRVTYLFTEKLQELFSAVLFEQGDYVEDKDSGAVTRVPCRRSRAEQDRYLHALRTDARLEAGGNETEQLGAQRGLLENELRHSPESVLKPVMELVRYAVDELCSREQLHTDAAGYVLFIAQNGALFELHCRDFLSRNNRPESPEAVHNLEVLRGYTEELGNLLRARIVRCIDEWIGVARAEVGHDHGWGSLTQNLPTLSVLHSYKALLQVPLICGGGDVDPDACRIFLGTVGYVRSHHTYGQLLKIKELSASQQADKDAMEKTLCEILDRFLQAMGFGGEDQGGEKRDSTKLRKWVQSDQPVWFTGTRGDQCIRVPLPARGRRSRGFKAPPTEVPEQAIAAAVTRARRTIVDFLDQQTPANLGRILSDVAVTALGGDHDLDSSSQWNTSQERRGLYKLGSELTVDAQTGEVLFGGRRIVPVPDDFAEFADFQDLFGRDSLQCYFSHVHENRTWINLVGLRYDLMRWTEPPIDEQG